MFPTVVSVEFDWVTDLGGGVTNGLSELYLHRRGFCRIQVGTVGSLPLLGHINLSRGRWVFSVGDGVTLFSVTRHLAGEAFHLQFLNRVLNLDLFSVNRLSLG